MGVFQRYNEGPYTSRNSGRSGLSISHTTTWDQKSLVDTHRPDPNLKYYFHFSKKSSLQVTSYLDDEDHGGFATRAAGLVTFGDQGHTAGTVFARIFDTECVGYPGEEL